MISFFQLKLECLASDIFLFTIVLYPLKLRYFQHDTKYLLSNISDGMDQIYLFSNEDYFFL